jgi:hypothetical protein
MNLRKLWTATAKLAKQTPDFVYTPERPGGSCSYVGGGDSNYPEQRGCIIGQAARQVGVEIPPGCDSDPIQEIAEEYRRKYPRSFEKLCVIQELQDNGFAWGQALSTARGKK